MEYVDSLLDEIQLHINEMVAGYENYIQLLCTIPGVYLKPCLVQVAHAALKDKKCDYYADKFNRIARRRGKKRAIIAVARKILTAIYHIHMTGEVFNPSDMSDIETTY